MDVSNNMKNKVMLALTVCQGYRLCDPDHCPYGDKVDGHECLDSLHEDALALLKAQEPMLVKHTTSTIRCPKCNKQITSRGAIHKEIKYCWKCGQAVKWE